MADSAMVPSEVETQDADEEMRWDAVIKAISGLPVLQVTFGGQTDSCPPAAIMRHKVLAILDLAKRKRFR